MDLVSGSSQSCYELIMVQGRPYRKLKADLVESKPKLKLVPLATNYSHEEEDEPVTCSAPPSSSKIVEDSHLSPSSSSLQPPYKITQTGSVFLGELEAPPSCFSAVIGPKGSTIQHIRNMTNCTIKVPDRNTNIQTITVKGSTYEAVKNACEEILKIVKSQTQHAQSQKGYDYFISIPLNIDELMHTVDALKKDIIALKLKGLTVKNFQETQTLHLTLTMLRLHSQENIDTAVSLLKSLEPKIYDMIGTQTLMIDFSGLNSFTNLSNTSSCYLQPGHQSSQLLQSIADYIQTAFYNEGLVGDSTKSKITLHASLLDVSPYTIDATEIAKICHPSKFTKYRISEIHLSQRFHYDQNGYYHCEASIRLP